MSCRNDQLWTAWRERAPTSRRRRGQVIGTSVWETHCLDGSCAGDEGANGCPGNESFPGRDSDNGCRESENQEHQSVSDHSVGNDERPLDALQRRAI